MANYGLDIVSDYDKAELNNVFDQTSKELNSRYDFKGTPAAIEWLDNNKTGFKLLGNSELQCDAILDIVRKKLAARNQSQKLLDCSRPVVISNLKASYELPFKKGLDQVKAKQVSRIIHDQLPKVKTQIQSESVRLSSASKDELQSAMQLLLNQNFDFPLSFTNFR